MKGENWGWGDGLCLGRKGSAIRLEFSGKVLILAKKLELGTQALHWQDAVRLASSKQALIFATQFGIWILGLLKKESSFGSL